MGYAISSKNGVRTVEGPAAEKLSNEEEWELFETEEEYLDRLEELRLDQGI